MSQKQKAPSVGTVSQASIISEVTELEGGKVNLSIAQVTEVLGRLSELVYKDLKYFTGWEGGQRGVISTMYKNGERRCAKATKKNTRVYKGKKK